MTREKHFLLVDDEEEIIIFLERFLKRLKISSIKATSGETALRAYDKKTVSCVFLDIHMKGIDGFTVLKELKRIDPEVKVIIIAGSINDDSFTRARELGAVDCISKPIDLGELREKISRYAG